jgi:peptide/nickel transport system permease protein
MTSLDHVVHDDAPRLREIKYLFYMIRRSPLSIAGVIFLGVIIFLAIAATNIAPYPNDIQFGIHLDHRLEAPSSAHFFGTDDLGRDLFSRVLYGFRISLIIGVVVVLVASAIGIFLGALAGFGGPLLDEGIMRITDIFLAIPSLVLALVVAAILGPSLTNAMVAISLVWWPWYARLVRSQTLSLKEQDFVEAARLIGVKTHTILLRHIIPNCIGPIIVQCSLDIGYAILTAASLGFLGVGAQPPMAEWGLMVSYGRLFFPHWWWVATFPGLAIFLGVLGFNLLGDGLRDILDPRLRR